MTVPQPQNQHLIPPTNRSEVLGFLQSRYEPERGTYASTKKRKRRPAASSESSFLENAFVHDPRDKPSHSQLPQFIESHEPSSQKKKKAIEPVLDTSSDHALLPPRKEIFEKRLRHKTREDRYEPKSKIDKESRRKASGDPNVKREPRTTKSRTRKIDKHGDDEPLRRFESQLVGNQRLTVTHCCSLTVSLC